MTYQALWLQAFALTVGIELAVAIPLLASAHASLARRALAVVVANLASHPVVWFVIMRIVTPRAAAVPVAEAWAVGSEAIVYALVFPALNAPRALGVSAVANAVSFLVGLWVMRR